MSEVTGATLSWVKDRAFIARLASGHAVLLDSPAHPEHLGPSPMELMLAGIAGCTAIDVVAILKKMRVSLSGLEVDIRAQRADGNPKYFREIDIVYRVRGEGMRREQVERAVELSHSTYCSATASLRPDCRIVSHIEILEGR